MKNARIAVAIAVALAAWADAAPALTLAQTAGDPAAVAFVGVHVVPMDREALLENHTVIVAGGRIQRIGPAGRVPVPDGALRVDARGKYLMPGLAEMHAHIPPTEVTDEQVEPLFLLYLANGITTVRGMLGHASHLALRDRVARGQLLGPRIYTSGPSLNGNSIPSPDSARAAVRHQKAMGYDFLKIHPGLTRASYDAMADEARRLGIPFAGHVPADVGLGRALEARQATIDHLDGYVEALVPAGAATGASQFFGFNKIAHADLARIPDLTRATRDARVWNVPTMSLFIDFVSGESPEALAVRPENRYMPRAQIENWMSAVRNARANEAFSAESARRFLETRSAILTALHRAGARLLLGSDAPQVFNVPGFSIHQELRALVDAGLTPYEALATGTRNVAIYFGAEEEFGTIAEGKAADLILLDANPLADVRNVQRRAGVVVRGRWLPEEELQRRLVALAAARLQD